jgi:hypothetical protein
MLLPVHLNISDRLAIGYLVVLFVSVIKKAILLVAFLRVKVE